MENKGLVSSGKMGKDVTTSLIIAEVFEKRHCDVLRDIDKLACSQEFRERNFALSSYLTSQNKEMPMYEITKDGFSFLAMGFTGEKAGEFKEKFINEFNKREQLLRNDDYIIGRAMSVLSERSKLLEQQLHQKDEKIKLDKPKVEYYDEVLQNPKLIPITIIAKELGMTAGALNKKLNDMEIQYRLDNAWVLYSPYDNKGYTGTKTHIHKDGNGVEKTTIQTYWTEKGRVFIHDLMKSTEKEEFNITLYQNQIMKTWEEIEQEVFNAPVQKAPKKKAEPKEPKKPISHCEKVTDELVDLLNCTGITKQSSPNLNVDISDEDVVTVTLKPFGKVTHAKYTFEKRHTEIPLSWNAKKSAMQERVSELKSKERHLKEISNPKYGDYGLCDADLVKEGEKSKVQAIKEFNVLTSELDNARVFGDKKTSKELLDKYLLSKKSLDRVRNCDRLLHFPDWHPISGSYESLKGYISRRGHDIKLLENPVTLDDIETCKNFLFVLSHEDMPDKYNRWNRELDKTECVSGWLMKMESILSEKGIEKMKSYFGI